MGSDSHILLFGGTGRLGPNVLPALRSRFEVSVFTRSPDATHNSTHRPQISCDLHDTEGTISAVQRTLAGIDRSRTRRLGILHMATEGITDDSSEDLESEYALAAVGLSSIVRGVVRDATEWDSISVVFASSMAVTTFPTNGMGYVVGKAAGESLCRFLAHHPPSQNWRFNILRIGPASASDELAGSVAALAVYLLSEDAVGISGEVFSASSPGLEAARK